PRGAMGSGHAAWQASTLPADLHLAVNQQSLAEVHNMAVPDFQTLMLPLLKLASDGQPHTTAEAVAQLAQEFQLSDDERTQVLPSGQPRLYNRVGWTTTYLKKAGLLQAVGPGRFQLTDRGRDVLASRPAAIDVAFLESQFPEFSEFRKARSRREAADEEPP